MKIEREAVDKAYNEIERRIMSDIEDDTACPAVIRERFSDYEQGLCSTFMMIADNWPEVRAWIDERRDNFFL